MHRVPNRLGSRVVSAVVATTCAAAMAAVVAPSATSAAPLDAAPKVGECRNYSMTQAGKDSNNSPVVPCKEKHTAKVVGVFQLPASVPWSDSRVYPFVVEKCSPKIRATLGRTEQLRHLSSYGFTFFIPTSQQREDGARWVRCDIALYGGTMLRPLPSNVTPMLPKAPLPNKVARCLTGNHYRTTCDQRHAYRATAVTRVSTRWYPGAQALYKTAKRRCPSRVSTPRNWYATWPTKVGYNIGRDRMIVCYSRRSN